MDDLRALADAALAASRATADPNYPLIHLAPATGRLNDPNGLLHDDGVWHAFYQLTPLPSPDGTGLRKLVYWGHATSTDLLHWEQHAPAIVPDSVYDAQGAYSGSAVILPTQAPVHPALAGQHYAFYYTGNVKDASGQRTASQCLVTSPDGRAFTKWPGNPLLTTPVAGYTAHFRDPQVTADPRGGYRMLLGVQREDLTGATLLYRSQDLLSWQLEGELTFPDAAGIDDLGYMWECPNLVPVRDELSGEVCDVLIWCPQGAARTDAQGCEREGMDNVFPCVYAVGHLEGTRLHGWDGTVRAVDHGFEFYAPQVFAGLEDQDPVLLGWAGNAGEDDQPSLASFGWVHTMTLPRRLALRGGRLVQRPVLLGPSWGPELTTPQRASVPVGTSLPVLAGERSWWLQAEPAAQAAAGGSAGSTPVCLTVRIGQAPACLEVRLEIADGQTWLVVDRSGCAYPQPGAWTGHDDGRCRRVRLPEGVLPRLTVIHDRSITEILVGTGEMAFTCRSFLPEAATGATVEMVGAALNSLTYGNLS